MRFYASLELLDDRCYPKEGSECILPMRNGLEKGKKPLRHELESYEKQGVELWLDGQPGSAKAITQACKIAEEGDYMRDYVYDGKGGLKSLSFDFVKK